MERKELESESIGTWDGDIAEYTDYHQYYPKEEADAVMDKMEAENRQLLYERLMAKVRYYNQSRYIVAEIWRCGNSQKLWQDYYLQWCRIANALDIRLAKIKEQM